MAGNNFSLETFVFTKQWFVDMKIDIAWKIYEDKEDIQDIELVVFNR